MFLHFQSVKADIKTNVMDVKTDIKRSINRKNKP